MLLICTQNSGKLTEFKALFEPQKNVVGIDSIVQDSSPSAFNPNENSDSFLANAAIKILSALNLIEAQFKLNPTFFSQIEYILSDDSGLCVPSLNFLPGVHSAYFSGIPRSDKRNNEKLIYEITNSPESYSYRNEKRTSAFFICFLLSCRLQDTIKIFTGSTFSCFHEAKDLLQNKKIIALEREILNSIMQSQKSGCSTSLVNVEIESGIEFQLSYGYCFGEVSTQEQRLISGAGHGYDPVFYPQEKRDTSFASMPMFEKNKMSHRGHAFNALLKNGLKLA